MLKVKGFQTIKIGYVPIRKFVFSIKDAIYYKKLIEKKLVELKINFVNIDKITDDGLLYKNEDVNKVVNFLKKEKVDAIFCPHCNFGTEDVAGILGKKMDVPYLLWGPRDEAPLKDGTRLRDTQCGLFATSKILNRLNVPFTYIPNCRVDDKMFENGIKDFIRTVGVVKAFKNLKIGQIGQRVDFFWSVMINEAELLEKFGIQIVPISIIDIINEIKKRETSNNIKKEAKFLKEKVNFKMSDRLINRIAALKITLLELVKKHSLTSIAIKCFPEFQTELGIMVCFANAELMNLGIPVSCETDIHGAITLSILNGASLNETPSFLGDLTIRHPENDNAELLWHCGPFPLSLADTKVCKPYIGKHFIFPTTGSCHWKIKGGNITISRFDGLNGNYSLAIGEAKGVEGPYTRGTYLWFEVNDWIKWEKKFIYGPYIHHVGCVHGSYSNILNEACKYITNLLPDPI